MMMVRYRFLGFLLAITYLIAIYPGFKTEHACKCFNRKSVCRYCSTGHENLKEGELILQCHCCNYLAENNEPTISGVCTCGDLDKYKEIFPTGALNPLKPENRLMKINKVFFVNCWALLKGYEQPPIRPPIS
jgi:hypothetical protein